ncbi:MAG: beta-mannanase [Synergistaceae bacterium]|jgi:hypothetical protein|nr:beta-mannanase [Synergistaceae bacterium]
MTLPKYSVFSLLLIFAVFFERTSLAFAGVKLIPPAVGVYHSAHPYFGLYDDEVDIEEAKTFTSLAGKMIVWSYISFNWFEGIEFPVESCRTLHKNGIVPLVGIMPWSSPVQGRVEQLYTLDAILRGDFDGNLARCAKDAASLGFPIMAEFGPEANGSWFPWSGAWNGGSSDIYGERGLPDGPERFRDAYRHVVDIFRSAGAVDVTWVFHVSSSASPNEAWNSAKNYYPGDEWTDWIGISLYGRLRGDAPAESFESVIKKVYPGLCSISYKRPIAILEFGVTENHRLADKAGWIRSALDSINSGNYPRLRAISWWNKKFRPDGSRSTLEINSSQASLEAYRNGVKNLVDRPSWSE